MNDPEGHGETHETEEKGAKNTVKKRPLALAIGKVLHKNSKDKGIVRRQKSFQSDQRSDYSNIM